MKLGKKMSGHIWYHVRTFRFAENGLSKTLFVNTSLGVQRVVDIGTWQKIQFNNSIIDNVNI